MKKWFKEKYEAQGFVEALMAILITGIGAVVFMTIAAQTIGEVVHNEKIDQLTQEAVKGSAIIGNIVEEWNHGNRSYISGTDFLTATNGFEGSIGHCYGLDGTVDSPFVSPASVCNIDPNGQGIMPDDCLSSSTKWDSVVIDVANGGVEDMFRIACVSNESVESSMTLAVRIYTGFRACSNLTDLVREVNDADSECDMYEYISVYKLEPIAQ